MLHLLNSPFAILAGMVLLPLIPSMLLFKLLPSTAVVGGPFHGFRIDLSGAFGSYFILLVLILSTKNNVWDPPPAYQVWTVKGTVTDSNGAPIAPLDSGDISLLPPSLQESNAWFTIDVPVKTLQGGSPDYPTIAFAHAGYQPVQFTLDPKAAYPAGVSVNFNSTAHEVQISSLRLQPLPAYQGGAPLNSEAAAAPNAVQTHPAGARQ
ncbi:MAG: hypothetical protein WBP85_06225 [Terracidiphilus sp.]